MSEKIAHLSWNYSYIFSDYIKLELQNKMSHNSEKEAKQAKTRILVTEAHKDDQTQNCVQNGADTNIKQELLIEEDVRSTHFIVEDAIKEESVTDINTVSIENETEKAKQEDAMINNIYINEVNKGGVKKLMEKRVQSCYNTYPYWCAECYFLNLFLNTLK